MTMRARFLVCEMPGAGDYPRARQSADSRTAPTAAIRFPLGRIVATPGALGAMKDANEDPVRYIARHACGDWGELGAEDREANQLALRDGERLLSAYQLATGERLWVITEADRSATTLLLPAEY